MPDILIPDLVVSLKTVSKFQEIHVMECVFTNSAQFLDTQENDRCTILLIWKQNFHILSFSFEFLLQNVIYCYVGYVADTNITSSFLHYENNYL